MGLLDRAERAVEKSVNSVFSRMGQGTLAIVDVTARLRQTMDQVTHNPNFERETHPNSFLVRFSDRDYQLFAENPGISALTEQLVEEAYRYAEEQQYYVCGEFSVQVDNDHDVDPGAVRITATTVTTPTAPAFDYAATNEHPIVEINGRTLRLTRAVTVLGRSSSADIQVSDSGVSRRHLELRITPQGTIATDLDSTNGTFVEDHRITTCRLVDQNLVRVGNTTFTFFTDQGVE